MREIALAMMLWISNATGYPITELPSVAYLSTTEIKSYAYGCDDKPVPKSSVEVCNTKEFWDLDKGSPIALYNHEIQTIILNKKFNIKTIRDKSVLFHELVHHLQYSNGQNSKVTCRGKLEEEAYLLQDKWLQEKYKVDVWETIGINELYYYVLISCNYDGLR